MIANSGVIEHLIMKQTEHVFPKMAEHLKSEHKQFNIYAERLYNLGTNRLLTVNWRRVPFNTGICNVINTLIQ